MKVQTKVYDKHYFKIIFTTMSFIVIRFQYLVLCSECYHYYFLVFELTRVYINIYIHMF